MARGSLQVEMKLDHLHCHKEGDGIGSSEAYLWTIYFKIDGDSVYLGDDLFLHGPCTLFPTPGSHGNLGDSDIDAGDDVQVPSTIGEFHTTLKPIPVTDTVRNTYGIEDAPGVVGVVCVLMEENWVSDTAAETGHVALNNFARQAIDNLIPTLGVSNTEVTDEQINLIMTAAADAVIDAISGAQGVVANIGSWIHGDDLLGAKVFMFDHDELAADAFHDMEHRFKKYIQVSTHLPPVLVTDFELFGKMQGIQPCPVAATTSLLKSQGFMNDKNARDFTDAANEFRSRLFMGDRGLGEWWSLAERNTASIAGVIRAHPRVVEKAAPAVLLELGLALGGKGKVSVAFVTHATKLLTLFVTHGPRRLRIDSKAALGVLPSLAGKPFNDAIDILRKRQPMRIPVRQQPGSKA